MVAGILKTVFFTLSMYLAWLIGMHLKTVLVSAVYSKVSVLKSTTMFYVLFLLFFSSLPMYLAELIGMHLRPVLASPVYSKVGF